jgi:hypothetical protein
LRFGALESPGGNRVTAADPVFPVLSSGIDFDHLAPRGDLGHAQRLCCLDKRIARRRPFRLTKISFLPRRGSGMATTAWRMSNEFPLPFCTGRKALISIA